MSEETKDARQLLADITAGLEGVTPGPWRGNKKFVVGPKSDFEDQSYGMIIGIADVYGENREQDTAHIARCDPETMQAIADLVAEQAQRIAELEAERQWRLITDLIPENGTIVMGWGEYRERDGFSPAFMRWYDKSQGWFVNAMPFYPTHWMPLPASPREGTQ